MKFIALVVSIVLIASACMLAQHTPPPVAVPVVVPIHTPAPLPVASHPVVQPVASTAALTAARAEQTIERAKISPKESLRLSESAPAQFRAMAVVAPGPSQVYLGCIVVPVNNPGVPCNSFAPCCP